MAVRVVRSSRYQYKSLERLVEQGNYNENSLDSWSRAVHSLKVDKFEIDSLYMNEKIPRNIGAITKVFLPYKREGLPCN